MMRRVIFMTAILFTSATTLISCRDSAEKETIVREVEVEKTEPVEVEVVKEEEDREGIFERTAKEVDSEVNKEIDEEIDKIGDDN